MNIILTGGTTERAIDGEHQFVTIGQNCWGVGRKASEALANCKRNAGRDTKLFITRVAPKAGFGVDPIDGSVCWNETHDAKNCPLCTVGKGIRINTEKSFKE